MAQGLPCKTLAWQSGTDADAAGAAAGAAAGTAAAASAVCIYYVVIGGRFAPPYKYMNKYIQQKQQQQQFQQQLQQQLQQHQHLCLTAMQGSCMAGLIVSQAQCKAAYSLFVRPCGSPAAIS